MFAAANRRTEAMRALLAAGAKVDMASKVVNLKSTTLSPEEEAFLAAQAAAAADGAERRPGGHARRRRRHPRRATARRAARADARRGTAAARQPAAVADGGGGGRRWWRTRRRARPAVAGLTRQFSYAELASAQGGLTPLLFAVRQGHLEGAALLLDAGAGVNAVSGADKTSPLLMAVINGHFDLADVLLERGANPNLASENGVTPLYAALNVQWAPRALYPQPRAYLQQKLTYLEMMKRLIDKGADVNARLNKKVWYSEYNFPLSGVDEIGATPFWRAAYASDVDAMRLLVAHGADPNIPTMKPAGRPRTGDAAGRETIDDVSGLPPLPTGGPGVPPIVAAAGVGFGEGFAGNSHPQRAERLPRRGEVPGRGAARRRQQPRSRRQHAAPQRRRARRQRDDPVSRVEGSRREGRQPRRRNHRRHGQQPGLAHRALPGDDRAARQAGREEQRQVQGL